MPKLKKTIQDKFDHLWPLADGTLEFREFEWAFEVFLLWCVIKSKEEIDELIEKLQGPVVKYLEESGWEKPKDDGTEEAP